MWTTKTKSFTQSLRLLCEIYFTNVFELVN